MTGNFGWCLGPTYHHDKCPKTSPSGLRCTCKCHLTEEDINQMLGELI